jgi:hypothetical protein
MFIETHTDTISEEKVALAFIKSLNVQAFPCGRRRSTVLQDLNSRIPFDPEARLNTEFNNIRHSSLNGFTQTYLESWNVDQKKLVVALAGYLFSIDLSASYVTPNDFGSKLALAEVLGANIDNIYLNILIEDTPLFAGEPRGYDTSVLGRLAISNDESAIDLPAGGKTDSSSSNDDYYFSGLALSSTPLVGAVRNKYEKVSQFDTRDDFQFSYVVDEYKSVKKRVVSLHLLEKVEGTWKIHEQARLPQVRHGEFENSTVIDDLYVDKLHGNEADIANVNVDTLVAEKVVADQISVVTLDAESANIPSFGTDSITVKEDIKLRGKSLPTIQIINNQIHINFNS